MVDGVKSSREVEEKEDGDETRVGGEEEVIRDFEEGSFGTVVGAESRLKCFKQLGVVKMLLEL